MQEMVAFKEKVQIEIIQKEEEKIETGDNITQSEIEEILEKYGTVNKNEDGKIQSIRPIGKDYEIEFIDIYNDKLLNKINEPVLNAIEASISGITSSSYTHEDQYIYPSIDNEKVSSILEYSEGKFIVLKNCKLKFKGEIYSTTENTNTIFGYYKNESKPKDASTMISISATNGNMTPENFEQIIDFEKEDYFYLVWKTMDNVDGCAGSDYEGVLSFTIDIIEY